ncbi:MAG: glycosyl hydrolase [Prevotella sp.]|jgi:mannan endo-1,4-beta-mannosidase
MSTLLKSVFWALTISVTFVVTSCKHHSQDDIGDSGRTVRTELLLKHLASQADTAGYLLGHADDTLYGVGWRGDSARSDVQNAVGDLPALLALDISGIDRPVQRSGVKARQQWLDKLRTAAVRHFDLGGAVLLTWNPQPHDELQMDAALDSVASFITTLRTSYGVRVPVLFRPCLDGQGWWNRLSDSQYRQLWQEMTERLKSKELPNVLMVYSRCAPWIETRYPEEDVDIIEACVSLEGQASLQPIAEAAARHHKPLGVALASSVSMPDNVWTASVAPMLAHYHVAYLLTGANRDSHHFGIPFLGHPALSDFVKFCNLPRTLLLHDVNALYLPHLGEEGADK